MHEAETFEPVGHGGIRVRGRTLVSFSGCDYFRLARHPAVLAAARAGVRHFGLNVSASRLTTGNHPLYLKLERALARFFGAEAALLVPTGYLAGLAAAQGLAGRFTHALIDERAHPALLDAAPALGCPVRNFRHCDATDLLRALVACGPAAQPLVMTDGLFPIDGAVAPLAAYLRLLPRAGMILVDDAHGAGVLGARGRGTPEAEGVGRGRIVQCVTLSKAFGAHGGAVLGTRAVRRAIVDRSRVFAGSTPVPLPVANAALAAVGIMTRDRARLLRLRANTQRLKAALKAAGIDAAAGPVPIVPFHPGSARGAAASKRALLAAGIYPPFVRYPGAPADGLFRFVVSSEHTPAQLDALAAVLVEASSHST